VSRILCVRTQEEVAISASVDSVFAGYQKDLYEKYHLQLLVDENIQDDLKDYLQYYENPAKGFQKGGTYCKFTVQTVDIQYMGYALDNRAFALQEQIKHEVESITYKHLSSTITKSLEEYQNASQDSSEENAILDEVNDILQQQEEVSEENFAVTSENTNSSTSRVELDAVQNLIDTVKTIKKNGILGLLGMEEISDRKVNTSNLPSQDTTIQEEIEVNQLTQLELNTYILEYMPSYSVEGSNTYDLEYVLGNADSDKENIKTVLKQIFEMRQGVNQAYLFSCSSKQEEVEDMVRTLTEGTLFEGKEELLCECIQTAWAYMESIIDMKQLIKGNSIPLTKDDSSWCLSLNRLLDGKIDDENNSVNQNNGMNYREYLEALLYQSDKKETFLRSLDIIQWNVSQVCPMFTFEKAVYELEVQVTVQTNPLFQIFSGWYDSMPIYKYQVHKTQKY
jgi:hypothetical protein